MRYQGKSLSIICGALRWLKDHETRERSELNNTINSLKTEKEKLSASGDHWLSTQGQEIEITRKLQQLQLTLNKLQQNDEKIAKLKCKKKVLESNNKKFVTKSDNLDVVKNDDALSNFDGEEMENKEDLEYLLEEVDQIDEESDHEDKEDSKYEGVKVNFIN